MVDGEDRPARLPMVDRRDRSWLDLWPDRLEVVCPSRLGPAPLVVPRDAVTVRDARSGAPLLDDQGRRPGGDLHVLHTGWTAEQPTTALLFDPPQELPAAGLLDRLRRGDTMALVRRHRAPADGVLVWLRDPDAAHADLDEWGRGALPG